MNLIKYIIFISIVFVYKFKIYSFQKIKWTALYMSVLICLTLIGHFSLLNLKDFSSFDHLHEMPVCLAIK